MQTTATKAEAGTAKDSQVITLQTILGHFEEYLKYSIQTAEQNAPYRYEEQAKLEAYKECLETLKQIEDSVR